MRLETRKLSVALYGTGRATIELRLLLSKGEGDMVLASARFADAKTAACFGLEVVDYRTLAITRNPDAVVNGSSYASAIELTLRDGRIMKTQQLTLTVERKLTLAASGRIDPLRPASALVLKPSVKGMDERQLSVTAVDRKGKPKGDQTGQFAITQTEDGAYELRRAEGGMLNAGYVYTATLTGRSGEKAFSAGYTFKVKPSKAKAALSAKTVTLSAADPTSSGEIGISFADTTLSPIERVELKSKAFAVVTLDDNRWAIGFKHGVAPKKGGTMRLRVYLKGYDKPAATLKLKVKLVP